MTTIWKYIINLHQDLNQTSLCKIDMPDGVKTVLAVTPVGYPREGTIAIWVEFDGEPTPTRTREIMVVGTGQSFITTGKYVGSAVNGFVWHVYDCGWV